MTISTYTELETALLRRLHRTDLAGDIADLIMLAEKRISTMLRARLMETYGTISTAAGIASASLPSTLLGIESLSIPTVAQSIDYVTPDQYAQDFGDTSYSGAPRVYTTIGDAVYFGPTPDAIYSVSAIYSASVTPLTAAAPTNSLLTKWPNVYLYGALSESTEVTRNTKDGERWEARFLDAIGSINLIDWHAGGSMRVRTDVCM